MPSRVESERESESETTPLPLLSPSSLDGGFGFLSACLEAWNDETGQALLAFPARARESLLRIERSGRTVEDVRRVAAKKQRQWSGDPKMRQYIRPTTLLGDRFEEYLNEPDGEVEGDVFDAYDGA